MLNQDFPRVLAEFLPFFDSSNIIEPLPQLICAVESRLQPGLDVLHLLVQDVSLKMLTLVLHLLKLASDGGVLHVPSLLVVGFYAQELAFVMHLPVGLVISLGVGGILLVFLALPS